MTTPQFDLDVEPDEPSAVAGEIVDAEPEAIATRGVASVLPNDFPLLTLLRFIPDPTLKRAVDNAAEHALDVDVTLSHGLTDADEAIVEVKDAVAAVERAFADPTSLANQLHKRLTGLRAEFCKTGDEAVDVVSKRIIAEKRRREALAAEQDRLRQAEADRIAKAQAAEAAKLAAANGAPKDLVKEMKAAAKTATAPPVAASGRIALGGSSVAEKFKARLKGATGEPNPPMNTLSLAQQQQVRKLMLAVAEGRAPLSCFEIDWSYLNRRAASDKTTLDIPEIEAFDEGSLRKKARR